MKTKTHFAFRVDIWDDSGDSIVEHVAGVDDFGVAEASYGAEVGAGPWRGSHCGRVRGSSMNFGAAARQFDGRHVAFMSRGAAKRLRQSLKMLGNIVQHTRHEMRPRIR